MLHTKRWIALALALAMLLGTFGYGGIPVRAEELPEETMAPGMEETLPPQIPETTCPPEENLPPEIPEITCPPGETFPPETTCPPEDLPELPEMPLPTEVPEPTPETTPPVPAETEPADVISGDPDRILTDFFGSCSDHAYVADDHCILIHFTPRETGLYSLQTLFDAGRITVTDRDGTVIGSREKGDAALLVTLRADAAYTLSFTSGPDWVYYSITQLRELPLGKTVLEKLQQEGESISYTYVPETTGGYSFQLRSEDNSVRLDVLDSQGSYLVQLNGYGEISWRLILEAGERYTVRIQHRDGDYSLAPLELLVNPMPQLELNREAQATIPAGGEASFLFIPTQGGYTQFQAWDADASIYLSLYNGQGEQITGNGGPYAAAEYCNVVPWEYYILSVKYSDPNQSGTFPVRVSPIPELKPGEEETVSLTKEGETTFLWIRPEETDRYTLDWESGHYLGTWVYPASEYPDHAVHGLTGSQNVMLERGWDYLVKLRISYLVYGKETKVSLTQAHGYDSAQETLPTCDTDGLRQFTCIHCGQEIRQTLPAAHKYEDGCCSRCGAHYIQPMLPGYNHYGPGEGKWFHKKAYYSFTPQLDATYHFAGTSDRDTLGRLYDDQGKLLAHNDDADNSRTDFAITAQLPAGKPVYLVVERTDGSTMNGDGVELSILHDFEVVIQNATCTENGKEVSTCRLCGYRETKTLYAEHIWDKQPEDIPCDQQNTVTQTCLVCGLINSYTQGGYNHWYNESATCLNCGLLMNDGGTVGALTWSVDPSQTLTISCDGNMPDYSDTEAPWADYMGGIKQVVVQEGTTSIGGASFRGSFALESVFLPESLERIEMYAFQNSNVQRITIPAGVKEIQPGAFSYCYTLTELEIHPDNDTFRSEGRAILSKDGKQLHMIAGTVNGAYTIPDGVEEIAWGAFDGCYIDFLTVPASVKRVQQFAFYDFGSFDQVVHFLGDAPEFSGAAFAGPQEWEMLCCIVRYPAGNPTWEGVITQTFGGQPQWEGWTPQAVNGTCGQNLTWILSEDGTLTVSGTGAMEDYGFYQEGTNLYVHAPWYDYRAQIRKVVLEPGVTTIGTEAFQYCSALEDVEIPDTVTRIHGSAFAYCTGLKTLRIPDSVLKFRGHGILMGCTALEELHLPADMTAIPEAMLTGCSSLKTLVLPESLTEIMSGGFQGCTGLKTVVLPEGVVSLGYNAFRGCTNLKTVILPEGLRSIGHRAFAGCSALTDVELPQGLTTIGSASFENCYRLTGIDLPASVKKIGWGAFSGCTGLTEATIPEGVTYLGGTFWNCFHLKTVHIPDTVTGIGYWAFRNCSSLTQLSLPEQLQALGDAVFADSGITTLEFKGDAPVFTLPGGVTGSVYNSLLSSDSLMALELPQTLAGIGLEKSVISAYGNPVGTFANLTAKAWYPANNRSWSQDVLTDNYGGTVTWIRSETIPNRVILPAEELAGYDRVWVDGIECPVRKMYANCYVDLPNKYPKTMTAYDFCQGDGGDPHTMYPTSMKAWLVYKSGDHMNAMYKPEFDDILKYEGMSIRITGNRGIRVITSVGMDQKQALTTSGLKGFTLQEYGTVAAWADSVADTGSLALGDPNTLFAYAYRRGESDAVFARTESRVQFTNVLVNFTEAQCAKDLLLRPYMILEDALGIQHILYGGIVQRSIGYVAWQNRDTFPAGSEAREYVWNIIKDAYGVEPAAVEYTVTALDYFDTPVSGISLRFLQDGAAVAEAVTDDNGQVTVTLAEGNYEIAVPKTMYTDKTKAVVTKQQPFARIRVIAGVSGEEGEIYDIPTPILKAGATYVQRLQSYADNYFLFVPEEAGCYRFQGAVSNAVLRYWGNNTNFLVDMTDSTDYDPDTNAFTLNIKPSNLGNSYVLSLTGEIWGVLVIERIGDYTLDITDMEPVSYVAKNAIERDFSLQVPAGQTLTYIDVFGETVTCHKGADGYYRLNSQTGPILYVNLGETAPYMAMSDCMGVTDEYAVYNLEYVYYDESGTPLRKERYNECMREYVQARCETTDVYPLNDDLIFLFRQANAIKGWGDFSSPNYLFRDSNWEKIPDVNAEIAWMYAVCYLS